MRNDINDQEVSFESILTRLVIIFKFFSSQWIIITIMGVGGASLGLIYANIKPTIYTAETVFVIEDESGSGGVLGQLGGLAGLAGVDLSGSGGGLFQGDNIIQLYKSRTMIKEALLSKTSDRKGILLNSFIASNSRYEKYINKLRHVDQFSRRNRLVDSMISVIVADINRNNLKVSRPDKKLGIINVEIRSTSEIFSKEFADNLVQRVNDFYILTKTKKSLQNISILQKQADSVRAVMNGAIFASASTIDATPNLNPVNQRLRVPVQREQFNAEANKAILTELVKNLELAKMAYRRETPLIQLIDSPIYPLKTEKLGYLKAGIIGFLLSGFLTIILLILYKVYKAVMSSISTR